MLSKKTKNRTVIEMHKGKPHLRTEVSFLTPIQDEDVIAFRALLLKDQLKNTLQDMVHQVEETLGDTFECDVESVYVSVKHTL